MPRVFLVIRIRHLLPPLVLMASLAVVLNYHPSALPVSTTPNHDEQEVLSFLQTLLETRASALLTGDVAQLAAFYDAQARTAQWALEHEIRRTKYVQAWAAKRNLNLVISEVDLRIVSKNQRGNAFWITFVNSASFGYVYQQDTRQSLTRFGVGTRHVIEIARKDNKWLVKREWYLDPLDEDTLVPDISPAVALALWYQSFPFYLDSTGSSSAQSYPQAIPVSSWFTYNRQAAVSYADKYCGSAPGCGNDHRYNPQYRDYGGVGGDCTNFVSQALGDKAAGGLPMTGAWRYSGSGWKGAGSTAWVRTEGLLNHLRYSGMAKLVGRGTYPQLVKATNSGLTGPILEVIPGDVIGFQEKGDVVHFAIVTGIDPRGMPLVNSHTADRYRVPWDLGWDKNTVFWLFHISD